MYKNILKFANIYNCKLHNGSHDIKYELTSNGLCIQKRHAI